LNATRPCCSTTAIRAYNRHPDRASESWPLDRYAEDVALGYFALVQRFD
jgi:hypothetical protein